MQKFVVRIDQLKTNKWHSFVEQTLFYQFMYKEKQIEHAFKFQKVDERRIF